MAKKSPEKSPKSDKQIAKPGALEGDVLGKLPEDEARVIASMFVGPLPHPEEFNKYPAKVQNAIVSDARTQMKHRHKVETKVVESDVFAVKVGSLGTILIYILCIAGTIFLFAIGKVIEGVLIGGAAGLARSLVLFRSFNQSKENNKKEE